MQAVRIAALAIAATLALTGCATSAVVDGADARFVGQWLLARATDARGPISLAGTYITLTVDPDSDASGRGPCSDYRANIIGQPGAVFVELKKRALEGCARAGSVELDNRYLSALAATSFASIDGEVLNLSSPTSSLTFRRAQSLAIGGIIDVVWSARGETFSDPDSGTGFDAVPSGSLLLSHNGAFTLAVGECPGVTGKWVTDVGEILLQNLRNSESECVTPDDTHNRMDILLALEKGFRFTTRGDTMTTMNPRTGRSIDFVLPMRLVG